MTATYPKDAKKATPAPAPKAPAKRTTPPARAVRAVQLASGVYTVVEEVYDCPPTSTRVLAKKVGRVPAEDEVRIWYESLLGQNRFGDSGL